MSAVLTTLGLTVRFGGLVANDEIDLAVPEGEIVGLIGPNGAGKTTFIDAISGFVPSTGEVWLGDRRIDQLPAHKRARAGLARTWQSLELFDDLTVRENLQVAAERTGIVPFLLDLVVPRRTHDRAGVDRALRVLGIDDLADRMPDALSQGQRKLVSTARALASEPHVICMDEPAAGLDSAESSEFGQRLASVTESGASVLLVDHDMSLVLSVCDRIVVIDFGEKIADGLASAVQKDARVIAAYLGSE